MLLTMVYGVCHTDLMNFHDTPEASAMRVHVCPCCNARVESLGTLVFHPCPARDRKLRDFTFVGMLGEDGTTVPAARPARKTKTAPVGDGSMTPAQRAWATRRAAAQTMEAKAS